MTGTTRQGLCEFRRPGIAALARQGIDQVKRHSIKGSFRNRNGLQSFCRAMDPAEKLKRRIVKGLDTDRNAVHTRGPKIGEFLRFDG